MRRDTNGLAPFGLRLHDDLKEKLEVASQEAGRSLNSEMVFRLADSFSPLSKYTTGDLLDELILRVKKEKISIRIDHAPDD